MCCSHATDLIRTAQVAKNRTDSENQITATLLDIQNRLPGFQMYQHIKTEDTPLDCHLQSKIIDAYQTFIDFCMVVSGYYSQRGVGLCPQISKSNEAKPSY